MTGSAPKRNSYRNGSRSRTHAPTSVDRAKRSTASSRRERRSPTDASAVAFASAERLSTATWAVVTSTFATAWSVRPEWRCFVPIKKKRPKRTKVPGIWQDGEGRFLVRARWNDPKTRRRMKREGVVESFEGALVLLAELRGAAPDERATRQRFGDYAEQWMTEHGSELAATTRERYIAEVARIVGLVPRSTASGGGRESEDPGDLAPLVPAHLREPASPRGRERSGETFARGLEDRTGPSDLRRRGSGGADRRLAPDAGTRRRYTRRYTRRVIHSPASSACPPSSRSLDCSGMGTAGLEPATSTV